MKIAFITTFCTHYTKKTFEILSAKYDIKFYFFSKGDQWYWLREHGVQHGNFPHEYLPGITLGRTRITPTLLFKLLLNQYDIFIKCINGRFVLLVTFFLAQLKRKPFILYTGIWMRIQTRAHRVLFPFVRYIYEKSDAIVVYGNHVKRYLISEGISEGKIFVANHAIDNSKYDLPIPKETKEAALNGLKIQRDQKIILFIGRFEKIKGLNYLIEAVTNLNRSDVVLVLVGTGSEKGILENLARKRAIQDRLRFVDYIAPEETVTFYSIATVYVLPSITLPHFKEPWGLVVNEAFNQGLPVIATDAVGAAAGGLVQNNINGLIIPERNVDALSNALTRILDEPKLRDQMSKNARRIIKGWNQESMVQGFRNAIQFVTNKDLNG